MRSGKILEEPMWCGHVSVCVFCSQMFAACVCVSKVMKQRGDNRQFSDLCSHFLLVSHDLFSLCISISLLFQSEQNRNASLALPQSSFVFPALLFSDSTAATCHWGRGSKLLTTSSSYSNHQLTFSLVGNWKEVTQCWWYLHHIYLKSNSWDLM